MSGRKRIIKRKKKNYGVTSTELGIKAVYSIGCKTAPFFNHVWIDKNIYGILFTTSFMAPEGYNLLGLIDSVAQGNSGKEIVENCNKAYKYFQVLGGQKKPGNLFVNHSYGLFD